MIIRFEVPGPPIAAKRPRFARKGQFVRTYDPQSNVEYKEAVRYAFLHTVPDEVLEQVPFPRDVPLAMSVFFRFPRPKGHFGTGRNADKLKPSAPKHHIVKPDCDNLLKLIKDGLSKSAWHDDNQICRYDRVEKTYVERKPGTSIVIYPAAEYDSFPE